MAVAVSGLPTRDALFGRSHVDEVVDDLKVLRVIREQRHAVDVGGGGDREIERPPAGLTTTRCHDRVQPSALPCGWGVERKWVEMALDRA